MVFYSRQKLEEHLGGRESNTPSLRAWKGAWGSSLGNKSPLLYYYGGVVEPFPEAEELVRCVVSLTTPRIIS